jgi:serine/threonine-protein kinase
MTDVYLAFDTCANRYAVLKIVEESQDALTQLILEAERRGAAIQKQLHEADSRVIEVYEYGQMDSCFFIAMQYIEGRTITEILREEKCIEPVRAARIAIEPEAHAASCRLVGSPQKFGSISRRAIPTTRSLSAVFTTRS